MLRLPVRVALAAAVALCAGCATEMLTDKDRAMMAGRYAELETKAEAQVPDMKTAKTTKLAPLCLAYAKLKRYDKLNPCLDQLEKMLADREAEGAAGQDQGMVARVQRRQELCRHDRRAAHRVP